LSGRGKKEKKNHNIRHLWAKKKKSSNSSKKLNSSAGRPGEKKEERARTAVFDLEAERKKGRAVAVTPRHKKGVEPR